MLMLSVLWCLLLMNREPKQTSHMYSTVFGVCVVSSLQKAKKNGHNSPILFIQLTIYTQLLAILSSCTSFVPRIVCCVYIFIVAARHADHSVENRGQAKIGGRIIKKNQKVEI